MIRRPPKPTLFPSPTLSRSASACVTYVRRPSRNASHSCISAPKDSPIASSQNGSVQPPYSKPPSRSSSGPPRSEEHTSELQSQSNLVCRLLLEKKKPSAPNADTKPRPRPACRPDTPAIHATSRNGRGGPAGPPSLPARAHGAATKRATYMESCV